MPGTGLSQPESIFDISVTAEHNGTLFCNPDSFFRSPQAGCPSEIISCNCIDSALRAFERIHVDTFRVLVPHELLQTQKQVNSTCFDLLGCSRCQHRSEVAMLVISMSSVIAEGLEKIRRACGSESLDSSGVKDAESDACQRKMSYPYQKFPPGGWMMDDEDQTQVLRALMSSRISKLDSLLQRMDALVGSMGWTSHAGLIKVLRNRVTRIAASIIEI